MKRQRTAPYQITILFCLIFLARDARAIQITELMYHPPTNESQSEWIEVHNEALCRRDIGGWFFSEGIEYTFPEGTVLEPGEYAVLARDPAFIEAAYDITNVLGPFLGRLDNSGDHLVLRDKANGVMAEVDYEDRGKWPVAADGAGHSLTWTADRGDPLDADNWGASPVRGGSPGIGNEFQSWQEETEIIAVGEPWRFFKGYREASSPVDAWRQIGFDDSGSSWTTGATGIGYGDGDDATVLDDMRNNYLSIFCRKTFTLDEAAEIEALILSMIYDDGFIAYLNGVEVARKSIAADPVAYNSSATGHEANAAEEFDLTAFMHLLAAENVLAIQVHNTSLTSSDLSCIPALKGRVVHGPPALSASALVLNEVHFAEPGSQFIEIYNSADSSLDISGFFLSNDPDALNRFAIPTSTTIPAKGFALFTEAELGFQLDPSGDRVYLTSPSLDVVVDARVVERNPSAMAEGRWPDGADQWHYMDPTLATTNSAVLTTTVAINEIMYHPPSGDNADEYIEITNVGATTVSLAGWRISRGVSYDFPTTASIAPGQYWVIAKDRERLIARYGLDPAVVLGNFSGQLANSGERVRLRDANDNVADETRYWDAGRWSKAADGYGASLELIDPLQDNNNPQAWAASDETDRAEWTYFSYSGNVTAAADPNEHELHMHLMGWGSALIDDVRLTAGPTEYLANGGFETGLQGWTIMGTHKRSVATSSDALSGANSLKIVAIGAGSPGANHIEQDTVVPMATGRYRISFWAKWQSGNPMLVTRCWNNQLAQTHRLPLPDITGTPGSVNSVYQPNTGPLFSQVSHSPIVPSPSDPVIVRARVDAPQGVAAVTIRYRANSADPYAAVIMRDDGLEGDTQANDGLYAATLPSLPANHTVEFFLHATDPMALANTWPTDASRPALYRVENSAWTPKFPGYRIIMTDETETDLYSAPQLSNDQRNCTFIYGEKDVYYNCGVRLIGSPYHRKDGRKPGHTGYKVVFNADQKLHGIKWQARFDNLSNAGYRDRLTHDLLRKMGQPYSPSEWVDVRINSRAEGMHEDILPPGKRFLQTFYRGDNDGYLFELFPRFWYTADTDSVLSDYGRDFLTWLYWGEDKNAYRWYYRIRNHDAEDDYTHLIQSVNVMSRIPSATTEAEVAEHFNIDQFLTMIAVRTVNSNTDFDGRKNCYIYAPASTGKWQMLAWDCEAAFGSNQTDLNIWNSLEPQIRRFLQFGGNYHQYLNIIHQYLEKYFNHAYIDPWADHYYSVAGGLSPSACKSFVTNRRAYLLQQLDPFVAPRTVVSVTTPQPVALTPENAVELTGNAPVNTSWIRCNGIDYHLNWTSATRWYATLDAGPTGDSLTLEFLDYDKQPINSLSIAIDRPHDPQANEWRIY